MPLAQEAKKLTKKIKAEEEASQWSGILVEQLLNNSFTEQLSCIQSLQQVAPLHAAKDYLPKDIITILERLGKVDNMPFDKLYYLAENCTDCYYTSVIKTFVEIIKWSATDRKFVLVNMARALKYLEDFWPETVVVVHCFGKVSSSSRQFREFAISVWFSETGHFQEHQAFTTSNYCSTNIYC